jgi:hypothetical protein
MLGINPRDAGYTPILYENGEGQSCQGRKGRMHLAGTRGNAIGMRRKIQEVGAEVLASPRDSTRGKQQPSRMNPARLL